MAPDVFEIGGAGVYGADTIGADADGVGKVGADGADSVCVVGADTNGVSAGLDIVELADRLGGLVIFRDLLDDPALREISAVLSLCVRIEKQGYDEKVRAKLVRHVASFEAALF